MVDQVEITNVTGFRGVASEATLLLLLDAMRKQGGGSNTQQSQQRIQDLYNRSVVQSTGSLNSFKEAVVSAGSTVKDFSKELAYGGERLTDFSSALFGSNSIITRFIGFLDKTVDQFRDLSSVGASFNNSLFDMISSSSDAAMTIDSFVNMVRTNSQALSSFGGTVTQGAQQFARMSREFRLGIGNRFFEMGMTIDDVNSGLLGYLQLETMRGRRNLSSDRNLQQSAAAYISQLDQLSKLTGQQREQLMATQQVLQTDARTRNYINEAFERGGAAAAENARAIFAFTKTSLPSFHEALVDLSDGVAQSPLAQALENRAQGITEFMRAASSGAISQQEFLEGIQTRFGPQLEEFVASLDGATIDAYRSAGGFYASLAEIADATYEFSNIMNLDAEEARREARRTELVTATLGKFEQGIISLRKFIFEKFINSEFAKKIGEFGQSLIDQFTGSGSGSLSAAGNAITNFFSNFFGPTGWATQALDNFVAFLESPRFVSALEWLGETIKSVGEWFGRFVNETLDPNVGFWDSLKNRFNEIITYLFGERERLPSDVGDPTGPRSGGVLADLYERLTSFFEGFMGPTGGGSFVDRMTNTLSEVLENLFSGDIFTNLFQKLSNTIELGILKGLSTAQLFGVSLIGDAGQARIAELEGLPQFNQGTNGFRDFGSRGTLAMLHNTEAVVPKNSPAGEVLQNFFDNQNNLNRTGNTPTYSQSDMRTTLNQLNTTMERVAYLLQESNAIQNKTMKNTRSMTGNMFRGAGI